MSEPDPSPDWPQAREANPYKPGQAQLDLPDQERPRSERTSMWLVYQNLLWASLAFFALLWLMF